MEPHRLVVNHVFLRDVVQVGLGVFQPGLGSLSLSDDLLQIGLLPPQPQ